MWENIFVSNAGNGMLACNKWCIGICFKKELFPFILGSAEKPIKNSISET
jgi:hypothetical protein